MGQITEALNKVQRLRDAYPTQRNPEIVQTKTVKSLTIDPKFIAAGVIAAGITILVFVTNEINHLQKSFNAQQEEIQGLDSYLGQDKSFSQDELHRVDYRLRNEALERKIQINNLTLIDSTYYNNIMKSILANSQQIDYLNDSTKNLKNEVEKVFPPQASN